MNITKIEMEKELRAFLGTLFRLPEIHKVAIKDIEIAGIEDNTNILKGLNECYHDKYSDLDINAWVKLSKNDFNGHTPIYKKYFPRLELEDKIFGIYFQSRIDEITNKEGMRICLKSGIRIDFTCFTRMDETSNDLSMDNKIEATDFEKLIPNKESKWSLEKADSFWFICIQALGKLMRKDYLIADHLAHMLIMEGLVAQMIIRDETYGTNFHRYGYAEELVYQKVDMTGVKAYEGSNDLTYNNITHMLYQAAVSYDELIPRLNQEYIPRKELFFKIWMEYIS